MTSFVCKIKIIRYICSVLNRMVMDKTRITFFMLLGICASLMLGCSRGKLEVRDFDAIRSEVLSSGRPAFVVLSGLDVYKMRERLSLLRTAEKHPEVDFYCCDLSLPRNLFVSYMAGCDSLPAYLYINADGEVSKGERYIKRARMLKKRPKDRFNTELCNLRRDIAENDTLKAYHRIRILDSLCTGSPYFYYLALHIVKDRCSRKAYHDSLTCFADRNSKKDLYLLASMPPVDGDAHLLLYESVVDLGNVPAEESIDVTVPLKNIGTQPLIIYDYIVECSCLEVNIPSGHIDPGSSEAIKIKLKTSKEVLPVEQTIIILSNSIKPTYLTIKANVI